MTIFDMIDDTVFIGVCKRAYRASQHGYVGVLMIHGKQAIQLRSGKGGGGHQFQAQNEGQQRQPF